MEDFNNIPDDGWGKWTFRFSLAFFIAACICGYAGCFTPRIS